MKAILNKLTKGKLLSTNEAYNAMKLFQDKNIPDIQISAFLSILHTRGEHTHELEGFLKLLLENIKFVHINKSMIIDIVGTGGDDRSTFNISTAASLVVASAGITVAKHGGRAVSSQSGATDCIEALGIHTYKEVTQLQQSIEKNNFGFISAPYFNPFLNELGPLRRNLGIRTFFNILGPIVNPVNVTHRLIGVSDSNMMHKMTSLLTYINAKNFMVVHSNDEMDEISISAPTKYLCYQNGHMKEGIINPFAIDINPAPISDIIGGNAKENADIIKAIFAGEQGPKTEIVVLNAAAGLLLTDMAKSLNEGIKLARETINNGNAEKLLTNLRSEEKNVP